MLEFLREFLQVSILFFDFQISTKIIQIFLHLVSAWRIQGEPLDFCIFFWKPNSRNLLCFFLYQGIILWKLYSLSKKLYQQHVNNHTSPQLPVFCYSQYLLYHSSWSLIVDWNEMLESWFQVPFRFITFISLEISLKKL